MAVSASAADWHDVRVGDLLKAAGPESRSGQCHDALGAPTVISFSPEDFQELRAAAAETGNPWMYKVREIVAVREGGCDLRVQDKVSFMLGCKTPDPRLTEGLPLPSGHAAPPEPQRQHADALERPGCTRWNYHSEAVSGA